MVTRFVSVMGPFAAACARPQTLAAGALGSGARLLFELDASILEPDFDLLLAQLQIGGDFDAAQTRQVNVGLELLFQVEQLTARERGPHAARVRLIVLVLGVVGVLVTLAVVSRTFASFKAV